MYVQSAVIEVYTRCLGAQRREGEFGVGWGGKSSPLHRINASSGTSDSDEVGAFGGREGVKKGLSEFPQVTMKGVRRKAFCNF